MLLFAEDSQLHVEGRSEGRLGFPQLTLPGERSTKEIVRAGHEGMIFPLKDALEEFKRALDIFLRDLIFAAFQLRTGQVTKKARDTQAIFALVSLDPYTKGLLES